MWDEETGLMLAIRCFKDDAMIFIFPQLEPDDAVTAPAHTATPTSDSICQYDGFVCIFKINTRRLVWLVCDTKPAILSLKVYLYYYRPIT